MRTLLHAKNLRLIKTGKGLASEGWAEMTVDLTLLALIVILLTASSVSAAADLFKDKIMTLIVHYPPGGAYDRISRVLAQPLKETTGASNVIVQNKPGAVRQANVMQYEAKPDGLTLMITNVGVLAWTQLTEVKGVSYDLRKFQYLANVGPSYTMPLLRGDIPYTYKAEDLKRLPQLRLTGTTAGSSTGGLLAVFFENFGIKGKILTGYTGSGDQMLAAERGEAEGAGSLNVATGTAEAMERIDKGVLRPMGVFAAQRARPFLKVPIFFELGSWREDYKTWLGKLQALSVVSFSFLAPPATPTEVIYSLRQAFQKVLRDPRVEREIDAKVGHGLLQFMPGEEVQREIPPMFDMSDDIITRVLSLMKKYES